MNQCPSCSSSVTDDCSFCPSCGAALPASAIQPTVTSPPKPAHHPDQPDASASSSGSIDQARFTPGTMLAERYRIVGLLGKGGMGEVYRADDLKLRQSVALKFLPKALSEDTQKLERFHHEVRVARQVSHPNVCRVYDIAEADGQQFISMEYIDGEDLASVLRRMGKPSTDKAVQIARQLCAGLAAAHDKGVLHRDLKPHNVMIDGLGAVRVTDFGLAGFVEEFSGRDVGAGTPAYMAPEQLAGRGVSVKSDIYSLGLVLYELFTGRRMFEGTTREQVEHSRTTTETSTLTSLSEDLDPAIQRIVERCLEVDPTARPSSALAVAAALPGADPLAAALAAGETPSPDLVAGAGRISATEPKFVLACIGTLVVLMGAYLFVGSRTHITNRVPLPSPPNVLAKEARDLLADIGYTDPPGDRTWGFRPNDDNVAALDDHPEASERDQLLEDGWPTITFWYRESREPMAPYRMLRVQAVAHDPPLIVPGMMRVRMSPEGALWSLIVVPPLYALPEPINEEPDWTRLLSAARLDMESLVETDPAWTPDVQTDMRRAWKAKTLPPLELDVHVEAGAFRGRPVYFRVHWPWRKAPTESASPQQSVLSQVTGMVGFLWLPICLVGAILLARSNLRAGRADRRTAIRLGIVVSVCMFLHWLLAAHHVATAAEVGLILAEAGWVLLFGAIVCVMYLAMEPYFRKIWPNWLVSWVRLFDGRLRDPLVGRDILLGLIAGVIFALVRDSLYMLPTELVSATRAGGQLTEVTTLAGLRQQVGLIVFHPAGGIITLLIGVMMLLLLRLVLRRNWPTYIAFIVLGTLLTYSDAGSVFLVLTRGVVFMVLGVFVLIRFGLLTLGVAFMIDAALRSSTITPDLSAWYADGMLVLLAAVTALAIYAVRTSLGGNSLFGPGVLDE